jgi:hypothetical protein
MAPAQSAGKIAAVVVTLNSARAERLQRSGSKRCMTFGPVSELNLKLTLGIHLRFLFLTLYYAVPSAERP